jgi:DNA repair protein RadC
MNAKDENLLKINGIKEGTLSVLKIIKAVSLRVVKDNAYNNQEFNNLDELAKYLKAAMGYLDKEQLRVLFLNNSNALIKDEILQEGTINQTQIYPREIVKRALELSASSIIMAHNHPSGDLMPSEADINITKKIKKVCETIDIHLLEHMIITKNGYTPIISNGYLKIY